MHTINVIEPGLYTTVQDSGRFGFLRYGLPPSGVMDCRAFKDANALLGNDPNMAVLECTGTMPLLECNHTVRVAVVYADHFKSWEARAGDRICFEPVRAGYRAYVAVEGGIDVPLVMGSRSTYVSGKLGGFEGRVLRAGDILKVGDPGTRRPPVEVQERSSRLGKAIRVIPGPEADWFDCGGLNTFLTEAFVVSSKSDRTGIRLEGTPLSFRSDVQMVSAGLAFGTIQVPPSGKPIVMMADHPTTGGYPRIGNAVAADLQILAQLRPGDQIRFVESSLH
jgi:biotin-dependent carboxylase-like uncharacterized protein